MPRREQQHQKWRLSAPESATPSGDRMAVARRQTAEDRLAQGLRDMQALRAVVDPATQCVPPPRDKERRASHGLDPRLRLLPWARQALRPTRRQATDCLLLDTRRWESNLEHGLPAESTWRTPSWRLPCCASPSKIGREISPGATRPNWAQLMPPTMMTARRPLQHCRPRELHGLPAEVPEHRGPHALPEQPRSREPESTGATVRYPHERPTTKGSNAHLRQLRSLNWSKHRKVSLDQVMSATTRRKVSWKGINGSVWRMTCLVCEIVRNGPVITPRHHPGGFANDRRGASSSIDGPAAAEHGSRLMKREVLHVVDSFSAAAHQRLEAVPEGTHVSWRR